ncbi:hypothetical protein ACKU27_13005 [Sphingobium yanoikuyae]|jgi:hypothetical protein|uniref:hypothetical protein n=1 Tax=Sphingobium yanoikuyae TaxID=13690 RepID=UPI003B8EFA53
MARGRKNPEKHSGIRRKLADAIFVAPSKLGAVGEDQRYDVIICAPVLAVGPDLAADMIRLLLIDGMTAIIAGCSSERLHGKEG